MSNASEAEFGKNTSPEAMKKMLEAEGIVSPTFDKDQLRKLISHFTEDELRRYLFNALQPDPLDEDDNGFIPDYELEGLKDAWLLFENLRVFCVNVNVPAKYPVNFIIDPNGQVISEYDPCTHINDVCDIREIVADDDAVQDRLHVLNARYRNVAEMVQDLSGAYGISENAIWALVK